MNRAQSLWREQAKADHSVLVLLRRNGCSPCHQLHYLQMVSEKISKAYFWKKSKAPRQSHASFVKFLQALDDRADPERKRIAKCLGFGDTAGLVNWIAAVAPLAYELERLAPALAGDGPNPEYPWPRSLPQFAPVNFSFEIWDDLTSTEKGRRLMKALDNLVERFPEYA
jgi:hypothetical protein